MSKPIKTMEKVAKPADISPPASPLASAEAKPGKAEHVVVEQREEGQRRLELRNQRRRQQEINEINRIIENAWPPLT